MKSRVNFLRSYQRKYLNSPLIDLYDALVKYYKLDKDLFESYGKVCSLKRDCEDKDKDEDPPAGSDQGLKQRMTSKDVELSKGSKSKELKSSSSKGIKSQSKSSGCDLGNTDDQPNVEEVLKDDWFKKLERHLTPDPNWNANKSIDFRPPQTWINNITKAEKTPLTFDEPMSTPIDFSAYVMNNLKIENLTQEHLVGPAFNLLKGICRSRVELEYHFKEYRGRQVVHVNYFINNDLEYLKGGSSSRKYTTSTTKTKAAKYDDIQGIEDMVPSLWSPVKESKHDMFFTKRIIAVTHVKVMKWYDYGYAASLSLEEALQSRERCHLRLECGIADVYQRLIRSDELYKFSDGTLTSIRTVLNDIASNLRMDYFPKRRWSNLDKQRSRIMIKAINKIQLERRLMRNLEKLVVVQSFQRDPKAPTLSAVNQDLLYLKKGNSRPEKIMLSLYKFPAVIFSDDDIEERTSIWVDKCIKKFNPYARYSVEHWKNPHANIFYIKRQKESGKPKEEVYSNLKIVQVIKTYGELGHEHKFVTKIIARRANGRIVLITEPEYKNPNKNDIEDMYLLCINGKVGMGSYQQKVNLTVPTITFYGIEKYKMFSIVSEPIYDIIYKNNKKEKRVMRHQEHGYVTSSLSKEDDEYLQLFEEEIEERLKHRDQIRRWEMYVNGRPLGSRRESLE
ncbi:hypothetical protein Tco_0416969 [Tanacetum coccineum]